MKNDNKERSNGSRKPYSGNKKRYDGRKNKQISDGYDRSSDYSRSDRNDPSWYAASPQLLKDVSSLSFNVPLGAPVTTDSFGFTNGTKYHVPGIMRINYVPTFGISENAASPLNGVTQRVLAYIRTKISGNRDYAAADVMLVLLGAIEAFVYWAWLVRIYGILNYYKFKNRYTPKVIIESMGVDFTDLSNRMAEFRAYINVYANKISELALPSDLTYIKRAMWCVTHLWKDSNDERAQLYYLNPSSFFVYDEYNEGGGRLVPLDVPANADLDELRGFGDNMVAKLRNSDDVYKILGDVIHTFGEDKMLRVAHISETFAVEPEFSEEVAMQIMNATCWHPGFENTPITQDAGENALIYQPEVESSLLASAYPTSMMLNLRGDTSPEQVMVATRLMHSVSRTGDTLTITSCGSEIITSFAIIGFNTEGEIDTQIFTTNYVVAENNYEDYVKLLAKLSNFDYHPFLYLTTADGSLLGVFGDIDANTTVTVDDLARMNEVAIMSLLNSPSMGPLSIS